MKCIIRKPEEIDIDENHYIDKDNGELAIAILQCGKVSIPLSEQSYSKLIDSINYYNNSHVPCSKCKYGLYNSKDISAMSCKLKAYIDGVTDEVALSKFNKKYATNPMSTCQYNQPNVLQTEIIEEKVAKEKEMQKNPPKRMEFDRKFPSRLR